jgi:hypothetical protein
MGYAKWGLFQTIMQDLRLKWSILNGRAKNKTSGSTRDAEAHGKSHGHDQPSVEQYDTHQRDDMTNKTSAKKFCSMRSTRALMSMGYLPCAGGAWTTRTGVRGLIPSRESASAQRKEG